MSSNNAFWKCHCSARPITGSWPPSSISLAGVHSSVFMSTARSQHTTSSCHVRSVAELGPEQFAGDPSLGLTPAAAANSRAHCRYYQHLTDNRADVAEFHSENLGHKTCLLFNIHQRAVKMCLSVSLYLNSNTNNLYIACSTASDSSFCDFNVFTAH